MKMGIERFGIHSTKKNVRFQSYFSLLNKLKQLNINANAKCLVEIFNRENLTKVRNEKKQCCEKKKFECQNSSIAQ